MGITVTGTTLDGGNSHVERGWVGITVTRIWVDIYNTHGNKYGQFFVLFTGDDLVDYTL